MTGVQRWFFRRDPAPPSPLCRHCSSPLTVCTRCEGAWQGTGCDCGIGRQCPHCGRHWA